ncbi:MAG: phosphoadenylyl-sulfate reductase [Dermatophilaceae bacterium]
MTPLNAVPATGNASRRGDEELREIGLRAQERLSGADARDVIAWAASEFGPRWAIASSMQDAVLPHLVASLAPGVDVLFLATGYHFDETLATRDEVAARYAVRVRDVLPRQSVAEQDAQYGAELFARDPDLCCFLRKDNPLAEALEPYEAWGTGLRRAEASTRAAASEVSWDDAHGLVKVNPIVRWSDADVAAYSASHDVVRNPLLERGYPSIGCAPCTRAVAPGGDPRSGRWSGTGKTECGIHR